MLSFAFVGLHVTMQIFLARQHKILCTFADQKNGELSEWSKEHAWKVCIPQKGIESSNLSLSAIFLLIRT